jgi:Glycerate kinase family
MNSARLGNAVRIVIAPDKFKGSLSAGEAARCLSAGIREARADAEVAVVPMADGGEGTLDAALANGYERREAVVGVARPTLSSVSGRRATWHPTTTSDRGWHPFRRRAHLVAQRGEFRDRPGRHRGDGAASPARRRGATSGSRRAPAR